MTINKNKKMKLHTKYAEYILTQSSTPIQEIEWLVVNLILKTL